MVERNLLESNLARFLAGSHGCHDLLPPQELRKDTFPNDMDEGCMNAEERARTNRRGWRENGEPLDDKMISPLVSKVKCFRK